MSDQQKFVRGNAVDSPATRLFAITPSDTDDITFVPKGFMVTVAGNVNILAADDSATVVVPVSANTVYPIRARRIYSTSTTATGIIGLA